MGTVSIIALTLGGAFLGTILACIPGLHVASTLALLSLVLADSSLIAEAMPFFLGLIAAYVIVGCVPVVLFLVPDEGLLFAVNPAREMQIRGRGHTAITALSLGGAIGTISSSTLLLLIGRESIAASLRVLRPHWHWLVWVIIAFMLMSEWPQRAALGARRRARFVSAWRLLVPGLVVFCASGLMGLIVFFRSPVDREGAFAAVMPMVTGMFSVPWLVQSLCTNSTIPAQEKRGREWVSWRAITAGSFSGVLGGMFACIVPGVTAGVGGLLSGHACSLNGRAGFLIAQGCSRSVYMCGAVMLLFVPGVSGTRGACAMIIRSVYEPFPQMELHTILGAMMLATAVSLALTPPSAAIFLRVLGVLGRRSVSALSLLVLLALNLYVTGLSGILVMLVASAIGGSAMLYGARRMNCLACILVPVGFGLSGWGGLLQ